MPDSSGDAAVPELPSVAPVVDGGATWSEAPGLMARGVCMGTADVVPGVSGGTMALILGIYTRLIEAIKSFDREALGLLMRRELAAARDHVHWRFVGAVAAGQVLGIVLFTRVIPLPKWVVDPSARQLVYGLFFGLVVGSVVMLARDLLRTRVDVKVGLAGLAGVAAGLVVVNLVRVDTIPETPWAVFLCGTVAICAMILPGISGSFILLILGKYAYVLGNLAEFIKPSGEGGRLTPLVTVVLPFAVGCALGLMAFSRFLSWLLKRAQQATLSFMIGLMTGSLWVIWPFQKPEYALVRGKQKLVHTEPVFPAGVDGTVALTVGLLAAGVLGIVALDRLARRAVDQGQA